MKIGAIQSLALVGLGLLLGLIAATGGVTQSSWADADPRPVRQVAAETTVKQPGASPPDCGPKAPESNSLLAFRTATNTAVQGESTASGKKPNIVVIMGDDVGWFNIGAYHRGMMAGKTPNLDRLAAQGMIFTDYYAEASCTAGRANFITGQLPIRTGMTTVGQAGATIGIPAQAPTTATVLKSMGYATGQFGKNHLGDRNEFLPTVHGFDEFFGYLYHLDAMEDPAHPNYPPELKDKIGPRNMVHSWATDQDDPTEQPRWGKIGKQRIEDAGTLYPKRMETVDDEVLEHSLKFLDKAKSDGKPFFLWLNPTRMHIVTHLSEKYQKLRTPQNGWSIHEAGMAQLDDIVGSVMKKLEDMGAAEDTMVVVHDRQRHRELYLARRRPDAVCRRQRDGHGGRFPGTRDSAMARQGSGRQGRERNDLRARLVADLRRCRRRSEHRRAAENGQATRRIDVQGASRRLQPDGPDHRQGAIETSRDLVLRRRHARGGANRRFQVPVHRSAERMVRRYRQARYPDSGEPAARSLRATRE